MPKSARLYLENHFLQLCWKVFFLWTSTQPAANTFQQNIWTPRKRLVSLHLEKPRNITDKLLLKLIRVSSVAIFALGDTTDTMNINVFHKHRQVQRGTTHCPFSELFMEPEGSVSLMSSLAVSQNISCTSADFCLSFEVCSQGEKKKKEVPKHLWLFLKVWLQVCLNQSLFNESFSLPSAPHHPSGLWLYLLSMTSPIPDSHLPDFVPIPSVLVLGPPMCHCSSQSST